MNIELKKYKDEYLNMYKQINNINEELVKLLNKIEQEFLYNPFEPNQDSEVRELWEMVAKARNYNIY